MADSSATEQVPDPTDKTLPLVKQDAPSSNPLAPNTSTSIPTLQSISIPPLMITNGTSWKVTRDTVGRWQKAMQIALTNTIMEYERQRQDANDAERELSNGVKACQNLLDQLPGMPKPSGLSDLIKLFENYIGEQKILVGSLRGNLTAICGEVRRFHEFPEIPDPPRVEFQTDSDVWKLYVNSVIELVKQKTYKITTLEDIIKTNNEQINRQDQEASSISSYIMGRAGTQSGFLQSAAAQRDRLSKQGYRTNSVPILKDACTAAISFRFRQFSIQQKCEHLPSKLKNRLPKEIEGLTLLSLSRPGKR